MVDVNNGFVDPQGEAHRRASDSYVTGRIAKLAWFELAAAATRRAIARQLHDEAVTGVEGPRH